MPYIPVFACLCGVLGLAACNSVDLVGTVVATEGTSFRPAAGGENPAAGQVEQQTGMTGCSEAAAIFAQALCACEEVSISGNLRTTSVADSDPRAHVRVNGPLRISGLSGPVQGDLSAIGNGETLISALDGEIAGSLRVSTGLGLEGNLHVLQDAYLTLAPLGEGMLTVDGDLYTSQVPTADSPAETMIEVAGERLRAPSDLLAPCACAEDARLPISAWVAAAQQAQESNAMAVAPTAPLPPDATAMELPEGILHLDALSATGDLELTIQGPTSLFISGDLSIPGDFSAAIAAEGDLSLFVAGDVILGGAIALGSAETAVGRLYVGGQLMFVDKGESSGNGAMKSRATIGGVDWLVHLYAPTVDLTFSGSSSVEGSLFVRSMSSLGGVRFNYNADVQQSAELCLEE